MPVYFSNVAPTCPLSHDEPVASLTNYGLTIARSSAPAAVDLPSALTAANYARQIIQSYVNNRVINNVFNQKSPPSKPASPPKKSSWAELPDKRVKGLYKYYAKNRDGSQNTDMWVVMERIEQMVWFDKAWGSYLIWHYGDKGEGQRVNSIF